MADKFTISLIIPTISRPSLARALRSVKSQEWIDGDEVVVVGDGSQPLAREIWNQFGIKGRFVEVSGPSNDWGHTPRNLIIPSCTTDYLMALDDDDILRDGAVGRVRAFLKENPNRLHIFQMAGCPTVGTVWKEEVLAKGNVGTPMCVVPNVKGKLGQYTANTYGGDFDFIRDTSAHYPDGPVWVEEVICYIRPHLRRV